MITTISTIIHAYGHGGYPEIRDILMYMALDGFTLSMVSFFFHVSINSYYRAKAEAIGNLVKMKGGQNA